MEKDKDGKAPIRVIYEDSKGTPKDGVLAAQKLIVQDRTPVIVSAFSGILLAIAPIAEQSKVVLINGPANSPKLRNASPFLFNMAVLSDREGSCLAEVTAKKYQTNGVAFFYLNSEFGIGFMESFEKQYRALGGQIVIKEPHDQNAANFRESITKAMASGAKVAAVASYYKETALLIKQANEYGFKPQWVTYSGVEAPEFLTLSAGTADGMLYTQPGLSLKGGDSNIVSFATAFRAKYGKEPDTWSAQFYDIGRMLCQAARKGARTGEEFKAALQESDGALSVTGFRGFDKDRCVEKPIQIKIVKDGAFEFAQ
jgi:branched-chain amino acid transport system substrate-binding protein